MTTGLKLVTPSGEHIPSYLMALRRGWSWGPHPSWKSEQIKAIEADQDGYLQGLSDPEAKGQDIQLPDGSVVARTPSFYRWIWDGEFCGLVHLRWQVGTTELPPMYKGHIGYSVVHWKQRRGYAKYALQALLPEAKALGLPYVEVVTDTDNVPSLIVIKANGGVLMGEYPRQPNDGENIYLRFRIML
ncbi:hypothetical protein AYO42_00890 [Rhizomicrobium sp. SCGC AG-212-E05]|nr:hypothetical protein AYO42_00890 [Rhizomicrobium sp. SCGC AG-212-E05]